MLQPVFILIAWTLFVGLWLYYKRLPAMRKANVNPDDYKTSAQKAVRAASGASLPEKTVAVADNYNHLHEAPTIFYALALLIHVGNFTTPLLINLAWGYVILRIIHSLIQGNAGKVMIRFSVFTLSQVTLMIMAIIASTQLF